MEGEVQVRRATLADVPGIAQVHVQSWHATYPGILPATEIARHTLQRRSGMWTRALQATGAGGTVFVAERCAALLGFANTGAFRVEPAGSEGQGDGELNSLYLLPAAQKQGVGRPLFDAGTHGLREAGFCAMRCWVLDGNPAIGFYERLRGERVASKTFTVDGRALVEHCYRFDLR